jgi:hypothetical protein
VILSGASSVAAIAASSAGGDEAAVCGERKSKCSLHRFSSGWG